MGRPPTLVPAFQDYAQGRGMFVDPARVRSPKDKPRVENQVTFVRESWFDGEQFTGLAHARGSAEHWCRDIAGTRVHGTTRKVPRDVFEALERPEMMPPPEMIYDVPLYVDKASGYCHRRSPLGGCLGAITRCRSRRSRPKGPLRPSKLGVGRASIGSVLVTFGGGVAGAWWSGLFSGRPNRQVSSKCTSVLVRMTITTCVIARVSSSSTRGLFQRHHMTRTLLIREAERRPAVVQDVLTGSRFTPAGGACPSEETYAHNDSRCRLARREFVPCCLWRHRDWRRRVHSHERRPGERPRAGLW